MCVCVCVCVRVCACVRAVRFRAIDLHGLAAEHTAIGSLAAHTSACTLQGQDEGELLTPVPEYIAERTRDSAKAVGVYALYDAQELLQYVGFSRAIAASIQVQLVSPAAACA